MPWEEPVVPLGRLRGAQPRGILHPALATPRRERIVNMASPMTISRKTLLKGAGSAALATMAMAAVPALADEAAEPQWTHEADVVVVGMGGAGDAAAVAALENGASVIVLEKTEQGGGCTRVCGGLVYMGGGTELQKKFGIEDTPEDMKAYLTAAAGPTADPELLDIYCANSVDLYDWLVAHGVTFDGTYDDGHTVSAPAGVSLTFSGNERSEQYTPIAKPAPRGHTPNGGGAAVCDALTAIIEGDDNATVLYSTPATELVTDADGTVIGVKATDADGNEVAVKANKGVVLSAGAFTYNDAMLADYAGAALALGGKTGLPCDTGDGILMGMKIGAATKSMSLLNDTQFLYLYGDLPKGVLVNWAGQRFVSEDWYGAWIGRYVQQTTPGTCYVITDGPTWTAASESRLGSVLQLVAQADTIEDLVAQLDLPAEATVATINEYNADCEAGVDAWGKSAEYLTGLHEGPFCAINWNAKTGSYHTLGGLKINGSAEVVDLDNEPIPGLYAAGRTSCGIFGQYPGSGNSVADSLTFGRIAGESAAKRA